MQTILVVDDDESIRALVRDILVLQGYTVLDTSDPQEALRIVTQQAIHLLLTDVVMPLMKGTELARRATIGSWGRFGWLRGRDFVCRQTSP